MLSLDLRLLLRIVALGLLLTVMLVGVAGCTALPEPIGEVDAVGHADAVTQISTYPALEGGYTTAM